MKKFDKKKFLYMAIIIAFSLSVIAVMLEWIFNIIGLFLAESIILYGLLFCLFTFCCLIVYYPSIIADALSKRTKELEEREKKINDKK